MVGANEVFFEMKLTKDKMLCRFPINSIYKMISHLLRSGFLMKKVESCNFFRLIIFTLIACFTFSSGILINYCLANKPKTKEKPIKKDDNQNPIVEKYFFSYKKQMIRPFGARVKQPT